MNRFTNLTTKEIRTWLNVNEDQALSGWGELRTMYTEALTELTRRTTIEE